MGANVAKEDGTPAGSADSVPEATSACSEMTNCAGSPTATAALAESAGDALPAEDGDSESSGLAPTASC